MSLCFNCSCWFFVFFNFLIQAHASVHTLLFLSLSPRVLWNEKKLNLALSSLSSCSSCCNPCLASFEQWLCWNITPVSLDEYFNNASSRGPQTHTHTQFILAHQLYKTWSAGQWHVFKRTFFSPPFTLQLIVLHTCLLSSLRVSWWTSDFTSLHLHSTLCLSLFLSVVYLLFVCRDVTYRFYSPLANFFHSRHVYRCAILSPFKTFSCILPPPWRTLALSTNAFVFLCVCESVSLSTGFNSKIILIACPSN